MEHKAFVLVGQMGQVGIRLPVHQGNRASLERVNPASSFANRAPKPASTPTPHKPVTPKGAHGSSSPAPATSLVRVGYARPKVEVVRMGKQGLAIQDPLEQRVSDFAKLAFKPVASRLGELAPGNKLPRLIPVAIVWMTTAMGMSMKGAHLVLDWQVVAQAVTLVTRFGLTAKATAMCMERFKALLDLAA